MVRLVDLEEDDDPIIHQFQNAAVISDDNRPNPNLSLPFAVALSCYPIISELVSYIDLDTLDHLSQTCRQFRANLLQHRKLLIEQTLRCENEKADPARRLGDALNASFQQWTAYGRNGTKIGRISSGRVGNCARDKVGSCRRCGKVVCRNCTIKQPSKDQLKKRCRRLCRTCMKSPLELLTQVTRTVECVSPTSFIDSEMKEVTYSRTPCTCDTDSGVWICNPCGQSMRREDSTYYGGWAWRARYGGCGGIGAGLGEGNEGVECGRDDDCLDAKEVLKEIECDADELAALEAESVGGRSWAGSSYTTHEIVGIGGKVKKKAKKKVLVGAIVKEYDEERTEGKFLNREHDGTNRSWCSWCARVIPGKKDTDRLSQSTDSIASSSSSASA